MRFTEFKLLESTLQRSSSTSWPTYLNNLLTATNIGVGPQGERLSGQQLDVKSKKIIKQLIVGFDTAENKIEFSKTIEETPITLLPSKTEVLIKHLHKSAEIKGGVAGVAGSEKKPWNEGEVAETILGAALYARFTAKGNITAKDVEAALKAFTKNVVAGGFEIAKGKRNKTSPLHMIAMNKPLNNEIIDKFINNRAELKKDFPKGVKALEDKVEACAAYVNESSKVITALEHADENPNSPITIKTDGVGDQKGTKADLEIRVGEWEQLLSLKVNDVKQFGQESGSSGRIISSFFSRFIPDLDLSNLYMDANGEPMPWSPENGTGWPDMENKKAVKQLKTDNLWDAALEQVYRLTGRAYQQAGEHLEAKLSTEAGASEVVKNIYSGIMHHAQGGAQYQTLVILNPSSKQAWRELEFGPDLENALGHYKLEVGVDIAPGRGEGNHRLRIFGTPLTPEAQVAAQTVIKSKADASKAKKKAASGEVAGVAGPELLFQLRSYQQESGNMRNPVEMGPLLKDLTEVQQINNAEFAQEVEKHKAKAAPTAQAQPQVEPEVAPQPAPVADTPPKPAISNLQGNAFVAPKASIVPPEEEPQTDVKHEVPVAETGDDDKWTFPKKHHVDELERLIKLAKYH